MSEIKAKRNKQILNAWLKGMSIYKIAKLHNLTWTRTKNIIKEQQIREQLIRDKK